MEPLKPEEKLRILENRPQAQPQDIEEYEQLLAERFRRDPSAASAAFETDSPRERRLRELYEKLFG